MESDKKNPTAPLESDEPEVYAGAITDFEPATDAQCCDRSNGKPGRMLGRVLTATAAQRWIGGGISA